MVDHTVKRAVRVAHFLEYYCLTGGVAQEFPGYATPYRFIAACYAHLGRLDDARGMVQRLRMITPIVVHTATQYRNPQHRELFLSGLRLAAGETA